MRNIAIVQVFWHNDYCRDGYLVTSDPELISGVQWREVSDEEFSEIQSFIRNQQDSDTNSQARYVIVEKVDPKGFDVEFNAWKQSKIAKEETERLRKEKHLLNAKKAQEAKKAKEIEKAKKILEKHNVKIGETHRSSADYSCEDQ